MGLEWNKSFETGVEEVDRLYPVMVENVNAIMRDLMASRTVTDYKKNLDAIKNEFIQMFSYQESLMFMQKYNQYYQHKHHHETFLEQLNAIYSQVSADYFGSTAAQVDNMINNWFMQHIFMYDKLWGMSVNKEKTKN